MIFGGVSILASLYQITPNPQMTVVSQIASSVFGASSIGFYVIQFATMLILLFAANTAYNGLPQLMSILATDGFLPRRFADKGVRLVYSAGIIFASVSAIILVVLFQAQTHQLIPLYSVGVFISFTLAQTGMVAHWRNSDDPARHRRAAINTIGAIVTGVVCIVIIVNKFTHGAWAVIVLIAIIVFFMSHIRKHYDHVIASLSITHEEARKKLHTASRKNRVIVPVQNVNRSFIKTLNYAIDIADHIELYHISINPEQTEKLVEDLADLGIVYPLVIESAPYRDIDNKLATHIDRELEQLPHDEVLTVVMPQYMPEKGWHLILHNQTTFMLEASLMNKRNVMLVTVPYVE